MLSCIAYADASSQRLDDEYEKIAAAAYREMGDKANDFRLVQTSFAELVKQVNVAIANNSPESAVALVAANIKIVKQNIANEEVPQLTSLLLKHEAKVVADEIFAQAKKQNDEFLLAQIKFAYAKHYAETSGWDQATELLSSFNIANNLPAADADEAAIIIGAALQHQKKHRKAFEYYLRVKPDSIHYRVAQLNLAVAYIRQDWWTDAHIALKNAITNGPKPYDELANRLFTVLGFSQLQQGFYRDARETFKNVYIDSNYANRALLGLGVAALQQEDFIGALNAFDHLKQKKDLDITISECYLLSAFSLNKLGQKTTASEKYAEAIAYYEQQAAAYGKLANQINEIIAKQTPLDVTSLQQAESFVSGDAKRTKNKIANLQKLATYPLPATTADVVKRLQGQLYTAYLEMVGKSVAERQTVMENYLSQSRFGLAKLYDTK